jgi:hypothetical protein
MDNLEKVAVSIRIMKKFKKSYDYCQADGNNFSKIGSALKECCALMGFNFTFNDSDDWSTFSISMWNLLNKLQDEKGKQDPQYQRMLNILQQF